MLGKLLTIFLGLFVSILLIGLIELFYHYTDGHLRSTWNLDYFPPMHIGGGVGMGMHKGNVQRNHLEVNGKTIYDVSFGLIGDNMRPTVGADYQNPRKKFIAVFGGSNAMGEGVENHLTIASRLQDACSDCNLYSFAWGAFGTNMMMSQIDSLFVRDSIQEEEGLAIYFFASFHAYRSGGGIQAIRNTHGVHPHYEIREWNGRRFPMYLGYFQEVHPWLSRWRWLMSKSYIITKTNLGIDRWPYNGWELSCALMHESNRHLKQQFKKMKFVVAFIDAWLSPGAKREVAASVRECLAGSDIDFVDISESLNENYYIAPEDHHLNAAATKIIAEKLINNYIVTK